MNNTYAKQLKQAMIFLCLFILFRTVFVLIMPLYLDPSGGMDSPIDARVAAGKFFDHEYVEKAKNGGYDIAGYFDVYLPLDLAFPIIYTLMFLSIAEVFRKNWFYSAYRYLIFATMILDYAENIIFSIYLKSTAGISVLVAYLTTTKSIVFVICFLGFVVGLAWTSYLYFKYRKNHLPG